jgi:cupin fold WbuC family metalloprotein
MEFKRLNDEVLYTAERITRLDDGDMRELVAMAARNPRKRVRICTHADPDDLLHEMFIVHTNEAYVRPHRHTSRDESFHVLSGFADIVIFAEDGSVAKAVRVGGYESGHPFYCRIPCGTMHMVVIRSDVLVFAEATTGPFNPADVEFASWSPEDGGEEVWKFVKTVAQTIDGMK